MFYLLIGPLHGATALRNCSKTTANPSTNFCFFYISPLVASGCYCVAQVRIPLAKALRSRDLMIDIQKNHLKAAVKNQLPAMVDDRLEHDVKIEESTWLIEDKQTILITLEKVDKKKFHFFYRVQCPLT